MGAHNSKSPRWQQREAQRSKGQFWTPLWVARAMTRYALGDGNEVFDPAVGAGAFACALRELRADLRLDHAFHGRELDPKALAQAVENGLSPIDLSGVILRDFLALTHLPNPMGVVANPPYIRHHRLSTKQKADLRLLTSSRAGLVIDGRAGLHVYFLIHALTLLEAGQRLAFIVPADVAEGVFAKTLWRWIAGKFCVDAVVRFSATATPFPGVDTNPLVLLIRKAPPQETFMQATCKAPGTRALEQWIASGFATADGSELDVVKLPLAEAVERGVARDHSPGHAGAIELSAFATTLRGIATGANEFFFLTHAQAVEQGIPDQYFIKALGRTRDVSTDRIGHADLKRLELEGRPTRLLNLDTAAITSLPRQLRTYLRQGEAQGLPERALIAQRRPWYKMEQRVPPAFLFAYLGRRNARFIRNDAGVVPLTGFLCVYPRHDSKAFRDCLWRALSDSRTVDALAMVGKSYGSGAIKVEPRALARLPIPEAVVRQSGLVRWLPRKSANSESAQSDLFEASM